MNLLETKYINEFGETLTLRADEKGNITFNHEDCMDRGEFKKYVAGEVIFSNDEHMVIGAFFNSVNLVKQAREIDS